MKKNDTRLAQVTAQIRKFEKQTVANVVKTGGLLKEVKDDLLEHGEFQPWVASTFSWSYRTAARYLAAHDFVQKLPIGTFKRLNISITALYILAELGDDEAAIRDAIIASGLDGKRLTAPSVRDAIWTFQTERQAGEPSDDDDDEADETDDSKDTDEDDDATDDSDDTTDDTDDDPTPDDQKIVRPNALALLLTQLRDFAFDDPAWSRAIAAVGWESIGELAKTFETVLIRHQASKGKAEVKAAADRAEARAGQRKEKAQ